MDFDPIPAVNVTAKASRLVIFAVDGIPSMVATSVTVLVSVIAVILNSVIVMSFWSNRRLITPFTIHVLNLAVIDVFAGIIQGITLPYRNTDSEWFHSRPNCAVFRLLTSLCAMVIFQHFLICVDRWLALLVPIWYHRRKQVKYGWMASLCLLVYILAYIIPVMVVEFSVDLPPGTSCIKPLPTAVSPLVPAVAVMLPQVFIYISYPFLLVLVWRRRKQSYCKQANFNSEEVKLVVTASSSIRSNCDTASGSLELAVEEVDASTNTIRSASFRPRSLMRNTVMVAWLTFAQICVWLPNTILRSLLAGPADYIPRYTEDAVIMLNLFGTWLLLIDPLIFLLFLRQLRRETAKSLMVCSCNDKAARENRSQDGKMLPI